MNEPQGMSPRQRLRALLSIPEKERTEAEWEELNELEIRLASGNRQEAAGHAGSPDRSMTGGHPKPGPGTQMRKPLKKFHKRPPRRGAP
jgi:hypothetical protein